MQKIIIYLTKYMVPGILTFGVDLGLLWVFMEYLNMHYLPATAIAFTIGTSVNYFAVRKFVFFGTKRDLHTGYAFFMTFAGVGIVLTTLIMVLLVEILLLDAVPARILTATAVGLWNFMTNYFVNFKMHKESNAGSSEQNNI